MNKRKRVRSQFPKFSGASSQQGINCPLLLRWSPDNGQSGKVAKSLQPAEVIRCQIPTEHACSLHLPRVASGQPKHGPPSTLQTQSSRPRDAQRSFKAFLQSRGYSDSEEFIGVAHSNTIYEKQPETMKVIVNNCYLAMFEAKICTHFSPNNKMIDVFKNQRVRTTN